MNKKWKSSFITFLIMLIWRSAFAQLHLQDAVNNTTWRNIYVQDASRMIYGLPGAVCAAKQNTDTAPSQYASLPTVLALDAFSNALIYRFWDTNAQAFGYRRFQDGFNGPRGVISFSDGDIFVADTSNNRLVKLHMNANTISEVRSFGTQGSEPSQFNMPFEINIDKDGNIYVADTLNNRIQVFDKNLNPHNFFRDPRGLEAGAAYVNLIGSFAGSEHGQFIAPQGVAVNLATGDIYVADTGNGRIQRLDNTGKYISEFDFVGTTVPGIGPKTVIPTYIDVDASGRVFVVDQANDKVYVFESDLTFDFLSSGDPAAPFSHIQGIGVEKSQDSLGSFYSHGNIFISDLNRVSTFTIDFSINNLSFPATTYVNENSGCAVPITISYALQFAADVTVQIYTDTINTTLVDTVVLNVHQAGGPNQVVWDGMMQGTSGRIPAPAGYYVVAVIGTDIEGHQGINAAGLVLVEDSTPPVSAISFGGFNYQRTDLDPQEQFVKPGVTTFAISATDVQSGIKQTFYGLDTTSLILGNNGTIPGSFSEGTHVINFQSSDNVCNLETLKAQTIYVDLTPPLNHVEIIGSGCVNNGPISDTASSISVEGQNSIRFVFEDKGLYPAGVSFGEFRINGGAYQVVTSTNLQDAIANPGTYEVDVRSTDNMGNVSVPRHISIIRLPILPALAATNGSVRFFGNFKTLIDSYNSMMPYGYGNESNHGDVKASKLVEIHDHPVIKGTICQHCSMNFPSISIPADAIDLHDLVISRPYTITGGDYLVRNLFVKEHGALVGTGGQVRIWFSGKLSIDGDVIAFNRHPDNIWFIGGEHSQVDLHDDFPESDHGHDDDDVIGIIYAPTTKIDIKLRIFGSVIGSGLDVWGGSKVHKDDLTNCSIAVTPIPMTATPTFTPTITPSVSSTVSPTFTNTITPSITPTSSTPSICSASICRASIAGQVKVYFDSKNSVPPNDQNGNSWTSPDYIQPVSWYVAPVATPRDSWIQPCNSSGINHSWIAAESDAMPPSLADTYFRSEFSLPTGAQVTSTSFVLSGDNIVEAWLNGNFLGRFEGPYPSADDSRLYSRCVKVSVNPAFYRTGNNTIAFKLINEKTSHGLTFELCTMYSYSCGNPSASYTPTQTPAISSVPTPTPTPITLACRGASAMPNISRHGEPIHFKVGLENPGSIHLFIFNIAGERIYSSTYPGITGWNEILWRATNDRNSPITSGLYVYVITTESDRTQNTYKGKVVILH